MKLLRFHFGLFSAILFVSISLLVSCQERKTNVVKQAVIIDSVKKEKENFAETLILMHNRMGIRLEYNLNKQDLELWISPQAGKSVDYKDRNFSNRDDYTRLFDRISFPGLELKDFVKCDYDPFHSKVHYKDQVMHIVSLYNKPSIVVWFEKAQVVDFKSDKEDKVIEKAKDIFTLEHSDRGKVFNFVATIGKGEGAFQHQRDLDFGRSVFARANLKPNQAVVIAGELSKEQVPAIAKKIAQQPIDSLVIYNEVEIFEAVNKGKIKLKGMPELQKLIDINKRIFLSMQDASGAFRASIQNIYYLIWVRDGGIASPFIAYSGWVDPLTKWNEFQLANPTVLSETEPKGKFFGQLVNGKITKWEEDGLFYVVFSAFTHWTQTGDRRFISGKNLQLMEEAMVWLEKYCYDDSVKAFGRYHFSETPLAFSRGYGWDDAVGKPSPKWGSTYKNDTIVRAYDAYMNMCSYASYMMLGMMQTGPKAEEYFQKAANLEKVLKSFYNKGGLPSYGHLLTSGKKIVRAEPYGMDNENYLYAYTLPLFYPDHDGIEGFRAQLFKDMMAKPQKYFLSTWFSLLTSIDTEFMDEKELMKAVNYAADQCYKGGKFLPMPYSMKEMTDVPDGDPYHDIRPQAFTIGPWLSAMSNFGLKRLPFGIAARSTSVIEDLENYEYKQALIDFYYIGSGKINMIKVNGRPIYNSLQIPEKELFKGDNVIEVNMANNAKKVPLLVSSTVLLVSLNERDTLRYTVQGFGKNILIFKNTKGKFLLEDENGTPLELKVRREEAYEHVEFPGKGKFTLKVL